MPPKCLFSVDLPHTQSFFFSQSTLVFAALPLITVITLLSLKVSHSCLEELEFAQLSK